MSGASGRRRPSSRRNEPRKSFDFGRRAHAHAHHAAGPRRGRGRPRRVAEPGAGWRRPRRRAAGAVAAGRPLMPRPPPRTAASRRSRGRSRSIASSSACVPMPTIRPGVHDEDPVGLHDRADALGDDDHASPSRARGRAPRAGARRCRSRAPRSCRRRCRSPARFTSARAIARRWRWPPETFVPPWVIGASSPPSISSTKSRRLGDLERVPELLVGRVLRRRSAGCSRPCR